MCKFNSLFSVIGGLWSRDTEVLANVDFLKNTTIASYVKAFKNRLPSRLRDVNMWN